MRSAGDRRMIIFIGILTLVAAALRWTIATRGGLWRDEALFIAIVRLPEWSDMIEFLRFHESHPLLFYALMRVWLKLVGDSDSSALLLVVLIGGLLVPALYYFGRRLFSQRVGVIAAVIAVFSPPLVEYSAQIRPYSLLPLLVLVSCGSIALALNGHGPSAWLAYVLSTVALLYTHNWTWLICAGQFVFVAVFLIQVKSDRSRTALKATACAALILLSYTPWISALLFQVSTAGHAPLLIGWAHVALAIPFVLQATLLAPITERSELVAATAAAMSVVVLLLLKAPRIRASSHQAGSTQVSQETLEPAARWIFGVVPVVAVCLALLASRNGNMLQSRCLVMLGPLLLLAFAAMIDRLLRADKPATQRRALIGVVIVFFVADYSGALHTLFVTGRSNAQDMANSIAREAAPSDLLVIAPEWAASGFNHYYPLPTEQIDYPNEKRVVAVDFSGILERFGNPEAKKRFIKRIDEAFGAKRRVWLVSDHDFLRTVTERDLATTGRHPNPIVVARGIKAVIESRYGAPRRIVLRAAREPRYENLLAFVFSPPAANPQD